MNQKAEYNIYEAHVLLSPGMLVPNNPLLPDLDQLPSSLPWTLDLSYLKSLNSTAIRGWVEWMDQIPHQDLTIQNAPGFFLNQASQISHLLSRRAQIMSLYLSYFCEEMSLENFKTLSRKPNQIFRIPAQVLVKKDSGNFIFELDAMPAKTFKCLDGSYEIYPMEQDSGYFITEALPG
jgi:hypothetical protein